MRRGGGAGASRERASPVRRVTRASSARHRYGGALCLHRGDLGADEGAYCHHQPQCRQESGIAGAPDVAPERPVGEGGLVSGQQVHQQEGNVVGQIDRGDGIGKLDAVEQLRPAVHEDDIAEMHVAVAAAHKAVVPPLLEEGRELGKDSAAGFRQFSPRAGIKGRRVGSHVAVVFLDHRRKIFGTAEIPADRG